VRPFAARVPRSPARHGFLFSIPDVLPPRLRCIDILEAGDIFANQRGRGPVRLKYTRSILNDDIEVAIMKITPGIVTIAIFSSTRK
jgi:hypothetical protein